MISWTLKQFRWKEYRLTRTCVLISMIVSTLSFCTGDIKWGLWNIFAALFNASLYAAYLIRKKGTDV